MLAVVFLLTFLLTFLLPAFFRGARFVVLAGLLAASVALPADGMDEDEAVLVSSVFAGFAASPLSAGLETDGFKSDLPVSALVESTGLVSDFVSEVLVSEGFVSTFVESVGVDFLVAESVGAVLTAFVFEGPVEA